jgi:hypothetical protein
MEAGSQRRQQRQDLHGCLSGQRQVHFQSADATAGPAHLLAGVRLLEELLGRLAKIVDESDDGVLLERILDAVNVHAALIEERVEEVHGLDGRRPLLLVAEDGVDPSQKDGDEQNFVEATTEFADDFSHMWYGDEDAERTQTAQQEQKLGVRILWNYLGHAAQHGQSNLLVGYEQNFNGNELLKIRNSGGLTAKEKRSKREKKI